MKKFISFILIILLIVPGISFADDDLKSYLTFDASEEQIMIKGTPQENGLLSEGDLISFLALRPGKSFDNLYSDNDISEALVFMETLNYPKTGGEFSFNMKFNDSMPYGIYTLKVSVKKRDDSIYSAIYQYNRANPADIINALNVFKTLKAEEFSENLREFSENKLMFDLSDIAEMKDAPADLGGSFVLIRDSLLSGKIEGKTTDIESFDDVKYCIKTALALYSVTDSGNEEVYEKYASLMPDFFDAEIDVKKANEIYRAIEKANDTPDEKMRKVRISSVLSYIKNGTYADVAYAIENYADVLDIDLEYLNEKGVTPADAARYIDTDNAAAYANGMNAVIKEIADEIAKSRNSSEIKDNGRSSTRGGGSKSSGVAAYPNTEAKTASPAEDEAEDSFIFDDVKDLTWARDSVMKLYHRGVINGVSDNTFEPERPITREEFVKLAVMSFNLKHIGTKPVKFIDCIEENWYYPYVQIAYDNGIINGRGDGSFGAGLKIKREDMAVICLKLLEMAGKLPTTDKNDKFTDDDEISDYAKTAVMSLSQTGVISGFTDGSFAPQSTATRAQAAVVIDRLMSLN